MREVSPQWPNVSFTLLVTRIYNFAGHTRYKRQSARADAIDFSGSPWYITYAAYYAHTRTQHAARARRLASYVTTRSHSRSAFLLMSLIGRVLITLLVYTTRSSVTPGHPISLARGWPLYSFLDFRNKVGRGWGSLRSLTRRSWFLYFKQAETCIDTYESASTQIHAVRTNLRYTHRGIGAIQRRFSANSTQREREACVPPGCAAFRLN